MSDTNLKPALFQPQVQSTASHLSAMKAVLIEKLWLGLFFLGLLGAPASMMRIATTGWQRAYGLHLGVAVIILLLYIFGKNLPNAVKAWTIMTVLVTVALTGLLNFGLVSQSGGILIVFMILSGLLFRRRTAILISSAFMAAIIVIGTGFVSNRLNVPFDANTYMHSVSGWIFLFLGATLFGGFVAIAVLVQREYIKKLLEENELQQQQILHQSNHDALTDLPTLRLAMDRLQMALNATGRSGQKVALMFVDLDNFKNINDSFGHAAGDHLLQQVAQRMKKVVRPCDTVARVGGTNFWLSSSSRRISSMPPISPSALSRL